MSGQLLIDFCCDERSQGLARELAIMVAPYLAPGTTTEMTKNLASRMALLAEKRFNDFREPPEPIRCHTCDEMTTIGNRMRVAVCNRCSLEGRSVGGSG
jgi:hypothetical protein